VRDITLSKLELLLKRIEPKSEKPSRCTRPAKPSKAMEHLLGRLQQREWVCRMQDGFMEEIKYLRAEAKWILHLPRCRYCQLTAELDVERYNGKHVAWFLDLENSPYMEKAYRDCPKARNYVIDNYWWALERYEKTGTTKLAEVNTVKFILDRAKWAYKITGKQIHGARQMLKLVRSWNWNNPTESEEQYYELDAQFNIYSPLFVDINE
jgi:hypothetical protein